jgi:squalene-associated FAD-dependent desaturase
VTTDARDVRIDGAPATRAAGRIAVVGGGWAGMAAAVTVIQGGAVPTVYEAGQVPGGRARRVSLDGVEIDNGQHILIGAYRETLRILREIGVDRDAALLRMPLALEIAGRFRLRTLRLPAPLHVAIGLLGARGMNLADRLGIARFMHAMRTRGYRLAADVPMPELLAEHRQLGAPTDLLWEPLCVAALNTPLAVASAQVFLNVLRDSLGAERAASDLLLPRTDLSDLLPEPAARHVVARGGQVLLGKRVTSIAPTSDGLMVDGARFSAVILACAPQHAARLLEAGGLLPATRALLAQLRFEPIYTCYLQYPETVALPRPMLGLREGLLQWAFDRGALGGQRGLIAAVVSARGEHEELLHGAFAQTAHHELARVVPALPAPRWSRVIAEQRATFSCVPHLVRPANATDVRDLFLAGDYTESDYPATLEGAVRSGVAAARLALASLQGSPA